MSAHRALHILTIPYKTNIVHYNHTISPKCAALLGAIISNAWTPLVVSRVHCVRSVPTLEKLSGLRDGVDVEYFPVESIGYNKNSKSTDSLPSSQWWAVLAYIVGTVRKCEPHIALLFLFLFFLTRLLSLWLHCLLSDEAKWLFVVHLAYLCEKASWF